MPTRRLVVALAVLLFGVLGVGVVTALNRAGDDGKPTATGDPLGGRTPGVTVPPGDPVIPGTGAPTTPPASTPATPPSSSPASPGTDGDPSEGDTDGSDVTPDDPDADPSGDGSGDGADPQMPETGASPALALTAAMSLACAARLRRVARAAR